MDFQGTINGLINDIGKDKVEFFVKQVFGQEASLNMLNEVCLGESKGWAKPPQQLDLLNHIFAYRLKVLKDGFNWIIVNK